MNKEFLKFGDIEIEKQKFYYFQNPININNVDITKIVISNKFSLGKNGFTFFVYKNGEKLM